MKVQVSMRRGKLAVCSVNIPSTLLNEHGSERFGIDTEFGHDEQEDQDGMMWGMKAEEFRALPPSQRKRIRNKITARAFRAKRKGESMTSDGYTRTR